ncbi:hypothetical protein Glove_233g40 [Diversispora epigaea]|uniref:Uncharacterized protein n=1 Tax=Diversispora epigaea TaxID=1348612 RepID=A0A397IJ46_9GLOM|nr:hypothetical protein Glove_233g40 [Diversispora epigaea]
MYYLKSAEGGTHLRQSIKEEKKLFQWYLKSAKGGDKKTWLLLSSWYSAEEENNGGHGQYSLANFYFNRIGATKDK